MDVFSNPMVDDGTVEHGAPGLGWLNGTNTEILTLQVRMTAW
jgi:hypothetical protein